MPIDIHSLNGVRLGATMVGGIEIQRLMINPQVRAEAASDDVDPSFASTVAQNPGASFTTRNIDAIFTAGLTISGIDLDTTNLTIYERKRAIGGTRSAGATHRSFLIQHGMLVPRTLTIPHQGDAVLACDAVASYDGDNDPIVITENVSLPAAAVENLRFTLGRLTIGGIVFDSVKDITLDFGIRLTVESVDSEIWPAHVSISQRNPSLRARGVKASWFSAAEIPHLGLSGAHANSSLYLRKRLLGGTFVPDATTQHVKIAFAGLAHVETAQDARSGEPGETTITLTPYWDGVNAILAVSTGVAIP